MKDGQGMYLFVFLDKDRYDGYMWFSSLPEVSTKAYTCTLCFWAGHEKHRCCDLHCCVNFFCIP